MPSTEPRAARELAALRRRAEGGRPLPPADALRLIGALEGVLRQAEWAQDTAPFSVLPGSARGVHARAHEDWMRCDCPGAIPVMWVFDPVLVREGITRELAREAAVAAGTEER